MTGLAGHQHHAAHAIHRHAPQGRQLLQFSISLHQHGMVRVELRDVCALRHNRRRKAIGWLVCSRLVIRGIPESG